MATMAFSSSSAVPAVESQIAPTSASQSRRNRGQGRTRPFLSQACQKTKLCKFYQQGTCGRGDECSFAHGAEQIETVPDLQCTKLCPRMESTGQCNRGSKCKFAHSIEELRGLSPELRSMLPSAWQQTDAKVVLALNLAAAAGTLTLGEMIMHLAKIFAVTFEARPSRTTTEVPTELLAAVAAEQAWASLNLARSERLAFTDFLQLSLLPSLGGESQRNDAHFKQVDDAMTPMSERSTVANDEFSPRSSVCQTPSSPVSSPLTPSQCSFLPWDSPSVQNVLCVRNTFIDVKTDVDLAARTTRRARSLPPSHS